MTYNTDDIVKDVRIAYEQNAQDEQLADVEDTDTLEMEDIIRSKVADGLNAVRMAAPLSLLDLSRVVPEVSWLDESKGIGRVALPDDFLRLALFKMSDWDYGVSEAVSPADEAYQRQWSEYKGVRGNPASPVIALSGDVSSGGGVVEFFSSDSTDATATLLYVRRETGFSAESYDIEERIYRAVVLKTAALVAATYGTSDQMALLNTLCGEQLGNS